MKHWDTLSEEARSAITDASTRGRKTQERNWEKIREAYRTSPKLCPSCSVALPYKKKRHTYCSKTCAITANNKKRDRKIKKWTCLNCKAEHTEVGEYRANRKYCSNSCQVKYQRKVILEKWLSGERESLPNRPSLVEYFKSVDKYLCWNCGSDNTWLGDELILQIDHVDGNYKNNSPSNIRVLCPNCHTQTETYGSKNRGNGRTYRRKKDSALP